MILQRARTLALGFFAAGFVFAANAVHATLVPRTVFVEEFGFTT